MHSISRERERISVCAKALELQIWTCVCFQCAFIRWCLAALLSVAHRLCEFLAIVFFSLSLSLRSLTRDIDVVRMRNRIFVSLCLSTQVHNIRFIHYSIQSYLRFRKRRLNSPAIRFQSYDTKEHRPNGRETACCQQKYVKIEWIKTTKLWPNEPKLYFDELFMMSLERYA